MIKVIHQANVKKARKDRPCMASEFISGELRNEWFIKQLTFSEKKAIVSARNDGWKIKKGQPYLYQFNKCSGDAYVFTARHDIHKICLKYDVYPEE